MDTTIKYVLADLRHLQYLIDSRIDFLVDIHGPQDPQAEQTLRHELALFFEEEIAAGTYVAWLALDGAALAGTGGMKIYKRPGSFRIPSGTTAYIMNIYTPPAYRNKGIASEIMRRLTETGTALGVSFFELLATKAGEPIYEKQGFKKHSEPSYRKYNMAS